MKKEKAQPKDTTGAGPGKQSFVPSGRENKGGNAPRQDGKNSKDRVNAADFGWQYKHSLPGEKK